MEKPSGICIYKKDDFESAVYVRTTDLNSAIYIAVNEFNCDFNLSDLIILYFYEQPFMYDFKSDLFD